METVRTSLKKHGVTISVTLFALALAIFAGAWGDRTVFLLYLGGVVVCAYFGGSRPGVMATGVTALCLIVQYGFLPADSPKRSFADLLPALLLYVLIGLLVSYLGWECRFALGELSKWRRGETDLMHQLAEAKRGSQERDAQFNARLTEQHRTEEKLRRERDELRSEWEAADEKLINELNALRQLQAQTQTQLQEREQESNERQLELERYRDQQVAAQNGITKDLQIQRARAEQTEKKLGDLESSWKRAEEKFRKDLAESDKNRRTFEEELSQHKESEKNLRKQMEDAHANYERELSEWEQAFQEADAARIEAAQKIDVVEASAVERADALRKQLDEIMLCRRTAEDRLDEVIEELRPLVQQRRFDELAQSIDALWVSSRLLRSNLPLHMQSVELGAVIERVARAVESGLAARGQHLTLSLPLTTEWLWGDLLRLEQVFVLLADYVSRQARPNGEIVVRAERREDDLYVCVAGALAPVSAAELAYLSYLRVSPNAYPSCRRDGDFHLAIARSLAELHNGDLSVDTAADIAGLEITCRLPVLPKEDAASTSAPAECADSELPLIGLA